MKQYGKTILGLLLLGTGVAQARTTKPNIVLIMADDLGYECLGVNGGRSYQTPRLDALAQQGLRFTHCHSQPVCTPSRVKIMTGCYNSRNYDKGKHPIEGQSPQKAQKQQAKSGKGKPSYTRSVRDKRWKLYSNGNLFDVVADPDEAQAIKPGADPRADRIRRRFQAVLDRAGET